MTRYLFSLCSCIFNQLPTTQKKKTQKVFERSHRSWKRLIEVRDKMANTHTVYVYYYNEWTWTWIHRHSIHSGTEKNKKVSEQTKKENTARGSAFFCAFFSFPSSENAQTHTHNQNNKEIYMKERRGKGGINYFGLFFACFFFLSSRLLIKSTFLCSSRM